MASADSAAAGAITVSIKSFRPCAYATLTQSLHFFATVSNDVARSTSHNSLSATTAAAAGSNCSNWSTISDASFFRSSAVSPTRPAKAKAGLHAPPEAYSRIAPFASFTDNKTTAASSCFRSSESCAAYAAATAARSVEILPPLFLEAARPVAPPTLRPLPSLEGAIESLAPSTSLASSSSFSFAAATCSACGNIRRSAAISHAFSTSPPRSKLPTALLKRCSFKSTSAFRKLSFPIACSRVSSGRYSPGSIPGAF
mmetsp:Transcript_8382/g.27967  ORF Transcript_8382/g.27967 Transcript_8382/m.27967 type:complete len:256 (+) Transcript_8382:806-1573(+)